MISYSQLYGEMNMGMRFREDKATQAAALFLQLSGEPMDIIKLIKLMYLAERESIVRWGRPITYDSYYSLPQGPVLSITLNLINSTFNVDQQTYWYKYITERQGHEVTLTGEQAPMDQLSAAEEKLINEIYQKFGRMDKWKLCDYTHKLPEWVDPNGSSIPIHMSVILAAEGYGKEEIEEMESALEAEAAAKACLV